LSDCDTFAIVCERNEPLTREWLDYADDTGSAQVLRLLLKQYPVVAVIHHQDEYRHGSVYAREDVGDLMKHLLGMLNRPSPIQWYFLTSEAVMRDAHETLAEFVLTAGNA
jgi:hypothetical protein